MKKTKQFFLNILSEFDTPDYSKLIIMKVQKEVTHFTFCKVIRGKIGT